jgi:hypothetical protein
MSPFNSGMNHWQRQWLTSAPNPLPQPRIGSMTRQASGNMRMGFAGVTGTLYAVEASTDLLHCEMIGQTTEQPDGTFQFEDVSSGKFSSRFYRIVVQQ